MPPTNFNTYLLRQLEQASPLQTVLMLLDASIKFTLQAKDAIVRRDIQSRYNANQRTIEIITFLLSQQDETQGEAATRIIRILQNLLLQLMDVDFRNDPAWCDTIVTHLRQLRQGFASLQPTTNKVVAAPSSAETPAVPSKLVANA